MSVTARHVYICILFALWLASCGDAEGPERPAAQEGEPAASRPDPEVVKQVGAALKALAEELPYMALGSMLYGGRPGFGVPRVARREDVERHDEIMAQARARRDPPEVLRALLRHQSARVRTLAMVSLHEREDPRHLRDIASCLGDGAETFDGHPALDPDRLPSGIWPSTKRSQTVGYIAERILRFCGVEWANGQPQRWWEHRRDPPTSMRWMLVRMRRASWGMSRVRDPIPARLQALRRVIDEIPVKRRAWILLRLQEETSGSLLVSDDDLVAVLKVLGPDRLMALLVRKIPIDDPDLQPQPGSNHLPYKRMCRFVLQHARALLRPSDAERIMACAAYEEDYSKHRLFDPMRMGWWYVAAARLEPARARERLQAGMKALAGDSPYLRRYCADLALAWHEILGPSEDAKVLDWFFGAEPKPYDNLIHRAGFVDRLAEMASGRALITKIIHDPRFDDLDWPTLCSVVLATGRWLKPPIATLGETYRLSHPVGRRAYPWRDAEIVKKHPEKTRVIQDALAGWRQALRARVRAEGPR